MSSEVKEILLVAFGLFLIISAIGAGVSVGLYIGRVLGAF